MKLFQPPVTPTPTGVNLAGKTIIVTGANAGLGYETARQLLVLNASTVILAVRNTSKGEAARASLLADPAVRKHNPSAIAKVMQVDLASYASVLAFAAAVKREIPVLNVLLLNAGIGSLKHEVTADGHERVLQVNYLSNVLLTLELLPLLRSSADRTGAPSRLSWVGSRNHLRPTFASKRPLGAHESVLGHFDDPAKFLGFSHYGDTKLLCVMFLEDLAARVDPAKVIVTTMCPGMVDTNMTDILPFYLKAPVYLVKKLRARTPEEGAWVVVHATVVAGAEAHGKFFGDKEIIPHSEFIDTPAGKEMRERLARETREEMLKLDPKLAEVVAEVLPP